MIKSPIKKKINLALIGFGSIGLIHAAALRKLEKQTGIVLKAVADPKPKNKSLNLLYFQDYRKILEDKNINVVTIATPPNTHYQITKEALAAGKDVLLEKPPTLRIEQLSELAGIATKNNLVLFTAYHACYRPEVDLAGQELKDKKVREVEISYGEYVLNYHNSQGWIFNPEIAGGGIIMDSGINAISIIQTVLPYSNLRVIKTKLSKKSNFKVETSAEVNFTLGEIGKGVLKMNWFHRGDEIRQITFRTENDIYVLDIVQNQLTKNGVPLMGQDDERRMVDMNIEYEGVYKDFTDHLIRRESLVRTKELKFVLDVYKAVEN
ncbi:MAG: hypothetical protein UV98_C0023G0022 [Parcubacteria group bacterium GW2011_GWB1_43_6]|nr:MAG: hypothetical protein UV98_C0023G0022 [Parcubacteria group bacterium GW2011_GWB1_43_6]